MADVKLKIIKRSKCDKHADMIAVTIEQTHFFGFCVMMKMLTCCALYKIVRVS